MAKFGNYETSEQIATSGPFTLYKARGGTGVDVAVKVYESQAAFIGELWDRKAEQFVQAALIAKALVERGAKCWNPVFAAERTEEYAYIASALAPLSLPRFVSGVRRASARELGSIVAGIASGLIELRDMMSGRGHGSLNAGAVLLSGSADGGPGEVLLCDLASYVEAGTQSAVEDKVALGKLIFEMVMRREAPNSSGFAMTAEWSSLGPGGKILFELSESLYAGAQCGLTLETVRDRAASIPAPSSGSKTLVIAGVAAALVLGAGGAFWAMKKPRDVNRGDDLAVQDVRPTVKTGACITFVTGATEWTCEIVSKQDCDAKQGRYLGDDKPMMRYLADPREQADWPPTLTDSDLEKWKSLEKRAALLPETTAKYREIYRDALADLKAALARVSDDPKWVPRPEDPSYADAELSVGLQQKTVDEVNRIKAEFDSFRVNGSRIGQLVSEIDRITAGNISPLVDQVSSILAESEKRLEKLRADFDEQMFKDAGYDPTLFDFAAVRNDLKALQAPDPAGTTADPRKREDALEAASTLKYRVEEIDVTLGTMVSDKIREASNRVGENLPATLRDAFKTQIDRLASSNLGASEKYARARAADHWAAQVTKSFVIDGLAGLDGVFDPIAFERIKGEKASRSVDEFAAFVKGLDVFPAIDDEPFQQRLNRSSAELGTWRGKSQALGERALKVKSLLQAAYLPDEASNGESIDSILRTMRESPEWAELAEAFKPLTELEANINSIVRDDLTPDQLISVIRDRSLSGVTAPTRKRVAWKRLAARGDWPTMIESLYEMPTIAAELRGALAGTGVNASRVDEISRDEIDKILAARWLGFVNDKGGVDAGVIERLYSADTRKTFFVVGDVPEGLNDKARFNFNLIKARAEAANLTDGEIPAFIGRWEGKLSVDERLARGFTMWKAGKFATDWKQAGPGLAGWKVQNEESEDHVVYTKTYNGTAYVLRFNKVGESSMVCTTEATIGLVSMLLAESKAPYNRFFKPQLIDTGVGVSPWYSDGTNFFLRRPSKNANIPNQGWLLEDAKFRVEPGGRLFVNDVTPPDAETPVNFVSASGAVALAQSIGCRLPSVAEWNAARATGDATPNLRDGAYARQFQHVTAMQIQGTVTHFPSAGRFPVEDPTRTVDPVTDAASGSGEDGCVYFRSAASGSATFQDLVGNLAEWTMKSSERDLDVTAAQSLAINSRGKTAGVLREQVGVVGGSALSPQSVEAERFVPASSLTGFDARDVNRFSFSDVGFRLAFTAEGGGGGTGKPSETVRKRLAGTPYR